MSACGYNHDTRWLFDEIAACRYPQKFQQDATGCSELICVKCGGLWDHSATDRVIDYVMGRDKS